MTQILMGGHHDAQHVGRFDDQHDEHCTVDDVVVVQSRQALTLYLDHLASSGRRSMRSLLQQVAQLYRWQGDLESAPWLSLRYRQLAQLRTQLQQAHKSPNTIKTTLAAVRGILRSGFLLGHYPANEWQRIQSIPAETAKRLPAGRSLKATELTRLFKACERERSTTGIRDAAVIALMAYAGLRRSEVIALDVSDYDRKTGMLVIRAGKGQKQRQLVLPATAKNYLHRWLACDSVSGGTTSPSAPLFYRCGKSKSKSTVERISAQMVYGILRRRARDVGIAKCSPHDLRRTFVTRLLELGVDLNTTRQLAGHEQLQTTALYDRRSQKAQQKAMANFAF